MVPARQGAPATVSQIDLTPTMSFLLGLPTPFGSLGLVIPELLSFHTDDEVNGSKLQAEVTRINAHQIVRYLEAYSTVAGDLPEAEVAHVHAVLDDAERQWAAATADGAVPDQAAYDAAKEGFGNVTVEAQAMCRAVWATFNLATMVVGIAVLVGSVGAVVLLLFKPAEDAVGGDGRASAPPPATAGTSAAADGAPPPPPPPPPPPRSNSFGYATIGAMLGTVAGVMLHVAQVWPEQATVCAVAGYSLGSIIMFLWAELRNGCCRGGGTLASAVSPVQWVRSVWAAAGPSGGISRPIAAVCIVLHWACPFSDNGVVYQDTITSVLAAAVVTAMLAEQVQRKVEVSWSTMLCYAVILVCIRASSWTRVCREEQSGCQPSEGSRMLGLSSVTAVLFAHSWWVSDADAMFGFTALRIRLFYPLATLSLAGYYFLDYLEEALHSETEKLSVVSPNQPYTPPCVHRPARCAGEGGTAQQLVVSLKTVGMHAHFDVSG